MFNKKKLNFWRLAFIFTGITILVLFMLWTSPQTDKAAMMGTSMGNMMKGMHLSDIKIYDLFKSAEHQPQMSEMHRHHLNQSPIIFKMNFLSTSLIFVLLPFIIGGAVILTIVWIR